MEWKDSLSIGVESIDGQHKALISAVNELFDACKEGKGRKKITETMEFLQNYVLTHFSDEEALQKKVGFPGYAEHKKLHTEFIASFLEYKQQLDSQGPTIGLVAKFNTFVSNWLIHHISHEDQKIGDFIAAKV